MSEAGWHPDPLGRSDRRYYDGNRWTEHVVDASGVQGVDPIDSGAGDGGAGSAPAASEAPRSSGPVIGAPPPRSTPSGATPDAGTRDDGPVGDAAAGDGDGDAASGTEEGGAGTAVDPEATTVIRAQPLAPPPEEPSSEAPGAAAFAASPAATASPAPGTAAAPSWGAPSGEAPAWGAPPGQAQAWGQPSHGGLAPQGRVRKVDKVSVVGLVLALLGIVLGILSLFVLPWVGADGLDLGGDDGFSDARELAETGLLGALGGSVLINLAYFTVVVGGIIALGKALGSRAAGVAALALAVVGMVVLSVIGFAEVDDAAGTSGDTGAEVFESSGAFGDDPEDRLRGTAIMSTVVMVIVVVMAGIGLLLHGIAGRILPLLGLGLLVPITLGGALVLVDNLDDLVAGFADVDYSLGAGAWALVGSAALLAISSAVPGGSKQTTG